MSSALSVVILTHNTFTYKGGCIRHTLSALLHQRHCRFEVIVVDNGSTPECRDRLDKFCRSDHLSSLNARIIDADLSIGGARNLGAQEASTATLVFLDDDAILVDTHALSHIASLAVSYSHGYGAERLWTPAHPWFVQRQRRLLSKLRRGNFLSLREASAPPTLKDHKYEIFFERSYIGHFGFVQKYLFKDVGGFPLRFNGYGCEDDALSALLFLEDRRFGWMGALSVVHVDHLTPPRYANEHAINLESYGNFLRELGFSNFNIEPLLRGNTSVPDETILIPMPRPL